MIRLADNSMIADLRQIRKECFGEDEAYLDFYFTQRFRPEYTLVYLENNRAVASLTMLPCTLVTPRQSIPASYIYAVATLPAFQRRGISAQLSQKAEELLKSQDIGAAVLVPASDSLFTFYKNQGYATLFYRRKIIQPPGNSPLLSSSEKPMDIDMPQLFKLREQYLVNSECYIQWDMEALQYAKNECEFNGGKLIFIHTYNIYAFCYPEKDAVVVKETNVEKPAHLGILNTHIMKLFPHTQTITIYFPACSSLLPEEGETAAFGMWKPLQDVQAGLPMDCRPYIGLVLD